MVLQSNVSKPAVGQVASQLDGMQFRIGPVATHSLELTALDQFPLVGHHQSMPTGSQRKPGEVLRGRGSSAPLAAALHNADCVRLRRPSPWANSWCGCRLGPWCDRSSGHPGPCSSRAVIPGLAAYLPEELAAMGLPAIVELKAPLPPQAAAAAAQAAASVLITHDGNRCPHTSLTGSGWGGIPEECQAVGDELIRTMANNDEEDGSTPVSDNSSMTGEPAQAKRRVLRSRRVGDEEGENVSILKARKRAGPGDTNLESTDTEAVSEELLSSLTGETLLPASRAAAGEVAPRQLVPAQPAGPTRTVRRRGTHRHRSSVKSTRVAAAEAVAAMTAGSKATRKATASVAGAAKASEAAAGTAVKVTVSRRVQQWISDETVDPRTGESVTAVPPATFCSQCGATSTPVWRAGPFGHKTLCNACGVRWMKVAPKSRK